MNICFICGGYPTKDDPTYAFIRPVVTTITDMGNHCTVISPQSIYGKNHKGLRPVEWYDVTESGNSIHIIQPKVLTLSKLRWNGQSISTMIWDQAVKKAVARLNIKPDIFYSHFWDSAVAAAKVSNGVIPIIAVSGESNIRVRNRYNFKTVEEYLPRIKGLICVSSKNLNESNSMGLLKYNPKTVVLPNGFDPKTFRPMDKAASRKELNIDKKEIVACFVGSFTDRKGVNRVVEAAKSIPNLKLILIGKGEHVQESNQILFKGVLPHDEICKYLNASDFFVLPTRAEGCCNAIVEAIACGLPVVSSNLEFNWDILNENNSILVNPNSIEEISKAMKDLTMNKKKRDNMRKIALQTAGSLTIEGRCNRIFEFIMQTVEENRVNKVD